MREHPQKKTATLGLSTQGGGPGGIDVAPDWVCFRPATIRCGKGYLPSIKTFVLSRFVSATVAEAQGLRQQLDRRGA